MYGRYSTGGKRSEQRPGSGCLSKCNQRNGPDATEMLRGDLKQAVNPLRVGRASAVRD